MKEIVRKVGANRSITRPEGSAGVQLHLVSIESAAHILGRSVRTLRYWQADGRMPPRVTFARRRFYRREDLLTFALSMRRS